MARGKRGRLGRQLIASDIRDVAMESWEVSQRPMRPFAEELSADKTTNCGPK